MYLVLCQLNFVFFGAADTLINSVEHTRIRPLILDIAADRVR
jgi:hypothetical protein